MPFSLVKNEYFITFCKKLRPAYKLLKHSKLLNELLNKTYKNIIENITQHIKETNLICITSDS